MRDKTAFRVTNARYQANLSSDRVFFRRRCNDFNESRQRSEMFTQPRLLSQSRFPFRLQCFNFLSSQCNRVTVLTIHVRKA
jgi:hypothetical protein